MRRAVSVLLLLLLPCLVGGEEVLMPSIQFYDKDGLILRTFSTTQGTYYHPVSLAEISPWLIAAAVAAEDKRFYTHDGVDLAAVLRAAWQNAKEGGVVSGASTITQQLARAVSPRPKTLWGKAQEALDALSLERNRTKEEILEDYFNRLEFGNRTQGVQAASQFYFNTDASHVSVSQAAFLAGLLKSPTYYNPLLHLSRALKRRDYVLAQMKANGFIDEEIYQLAREEKLILSAAPRALKAPHFTQWVYALLPPGTRTVHTSLDSTLQAQAEQALSNHLSHLTDSHVTNGAVIVLENATGRVLAYVGSADFNDKKHSGQIDGVRALRQPGSALKPFVYGLALEQGKLTPATLLADTDTFFEGGFRPRNYDEDFHGLVSVRTALACSYNIPAVKAAEQVGASALLDLLHQLGFYSLSKQADFYGLGLSLGNGEVRLLELANAYAALARGGKTQAVQLAEQPDIKWPAKTQQVLSAQTAYLITDILKDNQARSAEFGLNSALVVPFEMAAKTGTSKDYKDNFALGYTPRWTVGVWVGNFDGSPMQNVSGVTGAGPILHDVALATQQRYPSPGFTAPKGIKPAVLCNETGLLAGPKCPHTHLEIFDEKHLPAVCSGQHQPPVSSVQITSPQSGDIFYVDPAMPRAAQQLKLSAQCAQTACRWQLDGQPLPGTLCETWWPLSGGKHTLAVTCAAQTDTLSFEVVE